MSGETVIGEGEEDGLLCVVMPLPEGDLSRATVLSLVSDQGSTVFAAALNLLYGEHKLRAVWFPGWNHQAHNIDAGVLRPLGMAQVDDKLRFISKMRYGPQRSPGAWNGQIRAAWEVT